MIEGDNYGSYRHSLTSGLSGTATEAGYDNDPKRWSPELVALDKARKGASNWIIFDLLFADDDVINKEVSAAAGIPRAPFNKDLESELISDSLFRAAFKAEYKRRTGKDLPASALPKQFGKFPGFPSTDTKPVDTKREGLFIAPLIAEADGYAAKLIAAGVLKQTDYDAEKTKVMGSGWTVTTATAFRDATKKALDDYNAKSGGGMGWLLPVGIAAAAFFALRK